jgi:hypothetical protein
LFFNLVQVEDEVRLPGPLALLEREQRPARRLAERKDQRPVRVGDVALRSRGVGSRRQLRERVVVGNAAVFRLAAPGAGAAAGEAQLERRVQRGSIHARLAAGDDLDHLFFYKLGILAPQVVLRRLQRVGPSRLNLRPVNLRADQSFGTSLPLMVFTPSRLTTTIT